MVGAIVVTGYSTEKEMPEFGLVTKIVSLPTISYFLLTKYVAVQFSNHFHAYEVSADGGSSSLVTSKEFFIHTPMHIVHPIVQQAESIFICCDHIAQQSICRWGYTDTTALLISYSITLRRCNILVDISHIYACILLLYGQIIVGLVGKLTFKPALPFMIKIL